MSIKHIKHYSITTPASQYDEEAMTALELASRTAAKTNECVTVVNEMYENMPNVVAADVEKHIKNGDFDDQISEYAGDLEGRLNTILNAFPSGGTSSDAELADVRFDGNITWPSAGVATRATRDAVNVISDTISDMIRVGAVSVDYMNLGTHYYNEQKFISSKGILTDTDSSQYKTLTITNIKPHSLYYIKAKANYGNAFFTFSDRDAHLLSYKLAENVANFTEFEGYVIAPATAERLIIANHAPEGEMYLENTFSEVRIFGNDTVDATNAIGYKLSELITAMNDSESLTPVSYRIWEDDINENKLINNSRYAIIDYNGDIDGYCINTYEVEGGRFYHVKGNTNYDNLTVLITDIKGNYVTSYGDANGELINFDSFIYAPVGSYHMYVAYNENVGAPLVEGITDFNFKRGNGLDWSHIKWTAIGDSITEKNARASKNYLDYIHDETGIIIDNHGVSGSGVLSAGEEDSYPNMIESDLFPEPVGDVVTVMFSFNDFNYEGYTLGDIYSDAAGDNTVVGQILQLIENIHASNPSAKIGFITPITWNMTPMDFAGMNDAIAGGYMSAIYDVAQYYGIPVLDLFYESGMRPWNETFKANYYSKDDGNGVHPDENGHKYFYPLVREFLKKLI